MSVNSIDLVRQSLGLVYNEAKTLETGQVLPVIAVGLAFASGTISLSTSIRVLSNISTITKAMQFTATAVPIVYSAAQWFRSGDVVNKGTTEKYSFREITDGPGKGFVLVDELPVPSKAAVARA